MADLMPMVHAERASLGEFLDTLTPDQWTAPTWCDKWNVQEVVAHLTAAGNITAGHFFGGFVKSGFSFDKFVDGDLRNYSTGAPDDVKARLHTAYRSRITQNGELVITSQRFRDQERNRRDCLDKLRDLGTGRE